MPRKVRLAAEVTIALTANQPEGPEQDMQPSVIRPCSRENRSMQSAINMVQSPWRQGV